MKAWLFGMMFILILFLRSPNGLSDPGMIVEGHFIQGGYLLGKVDPGSRVTFDGIAVSVGHKGDFLIGFHRDEPEEITLLVDLPDGTVQSHRFDIRQRDYDIQRIDGLPGNKVTPPRAVLERISREAGLVRAARARNTLPAGYESGWIWPVKGRISGVYGSQRILNGVPGQPHYGIDIAAATGTAVIAPADGVVSFIHPDMYYSGGTVMLDHGRGLASTFLHLENINVTLDQAVKQGEQIGTVGSTGRSTGPHLDWRVNWFSRRLDAALFAGPMASE